MQDRELLKKIVSCLEDGRPAALATIIATRGSTPREVGAKMLVYEDGSIEGTIGGGCGEAEVRRQALDVLLEGGHRVYQVDLTDDIASDEGLICGGLMDVFIERLS